MDPLMSCRAVRYVKRTHPNKSRRWCVGRYWGKLNKDRNDRWVFGDQRSGRYLLKFQWFTIRRHVLIRGTASPDDPRLREYWWERRKVNVRHLTRGDVRLAEAQDWYCPVCGMDLINGEELQRHHRRPRADGGDDAYGNRELLHLYCHQQVHARAGRRGRHPAEERL